MSLRDSLKQMGRDASEFVFGDHDTPSLAERANQANLAFHNKLTFEYDDAQEFGLFYINRFVDGLHPDISGFLAREVTKLENMLLDSLEEHVVSVFDSTFRDKKPGHLFREKNSLEEYYGTSSPSSSDYERAERREARAAKKAAKEFTKARGGPTQYGQAGNPFVNALVPAGQKKTSRSGLKGFHKWLDEHGGDKFDKAKDKFQEKVDEIDDHAQKFERALDKVKDAAVEKLSELLAPIVKAIKKIIASVKEKAIEFVHFLRDAVSKLLAELNRGLADAFTTAALTCLKTFLRENTELEDLERAAGKVRNDISTSISSFFSGFRDKRTVSSSDTHREATEAAGAPPPQNEEAVEAVKKSDGSTMEAAVSAVLSGKLSKGYAIVRDETREEFRTILSALETLLLDQLPGKIRIPLTLLMDGDPLGIGDKKDEKTGHTIRDLFKDLVTNIEEIANDILMAIKNKIFKIAAGSYEVLERVAWAYTQDKTVELMKVYLPSLNVHNLDADVLQKASPSPLPAPLPPQEEPQKPQTT